MARSISVVKQIAQSYRRITILFISVPAQAQMIGSIGTRPPTFTHELTLIIIGALLGGFLGPLLTIIDGWIGISPGAKQRKQNYAIQREIAESLRTLIALQSKPGHNGGSANPAACNGVSRGGLLKTAAIIAAIAAALGIFRDDRREQ